MTGDRPGEVTELLQRLSVGDEKALNALVPLVYRELRRLAHEQLRIERANHTLQSAALVNEAFLRLLGARCTEIRNRQHFVAVAARLMRQILVDYARSRVASKRDGGYRLDMEALADMPVKGEARLLALEDALLELAIVDQRQAKIVEMKFFGGLTTAEMASLLEVSLTTVERDWSVARL